MNNLPTYRALLRAIAETSAYRNNVPDSGAGFGAATIEGGFPLETMKDIDDGGIAPMGQDMNGLLHAVSSSVLYQQHGGMGFKFNPAVASALGGYPMGATLAFDDPANPYCVMSTIANNTTNFNTTPNAVGDTWLLVPKVMQWHPSFNYPVGYILTYQGVGYVAAQDSGPGYGQPVAPGTNASVWSALETAISAGDASSGRFYNGWIDLLPFRFSELPPGWEMCNGTRFADYTPQGQALAALPNTFRTDWGITLTAAGWNVPNLLVNGADGYFFRPVNGTTRMPGAVQQDSARAVTATANTTTTGTATATGGTEIGEFDAMAGYYGNGNGTAPSGAFSWGDQVYAGSANDEGGGSVFWTRRYTLDAIDVFSQARLNLSSSTNVSVNQSNVDAENRPVNIGMTPAIYLGGRTFF